MVEVIACGAELESGLRQGLLEVARVGASVLHSVLPAEEIVTFLNDDFINLNWPTSDRKPTNISSAKIATLLPTIDRIKTVMNEAFIGNFPKHEFDLRLRTSAVNVMHTDGSRDGDAYGVRIIYPVSGRPAQFSWRPVEGEPEVSLGYGIGDASMIAESPGNGLNYILNDKKYLRLHPAHVVTSVGDRAVLTHDVFSTRPLNLDYLQSVFA